MPRELFAVLVCVLCFRLLGFSTRVLRTVLCVAHPRGLSDVGTMPVVGILPLAVCFVVETQALLRE